MIKGIIFDVGGVLVQIPNHEYYKYLHKKSGLKTDDIKRFVSLYAPKVESGHMSVKRFTDILSKKLGIRKTELDWLKPLREGAAVDIDMMQLAETLHKDYRIAYLSNVDRERYIYARRILAAGNFDFRFASCYLGVVKPDHKVYRRVLKEMGMKPEEVVFIDNEPENVKGAREIGIHAIHFRNRRHLDIELARLNL